MVCQCCSAIFESAKLAKSSKHRFLEKNPKRKKPLLFFRPGPLKVYKYIFVKICSEKLLLKADPVETQLT